MCYAKLVLSLRLDVLLANRILSGDDTKRHGAFNDIIPASHWYPGRAGQGVTVSVKGLVLMLSSGSYELTQERGDCISLLVGKQRGGITSGIR